MPAGPRPVLQAHDGPEGRRGIHFNETDALSDSQRGYAEAQLKLFDAWYADWSKANVARKQAA
jgi:hypothetical protein